VVKSHKRIEKTLRKGEGPQTEVEYQPQAKAVDDAEPRHEFHLMAKPADVPQPEDNSNKRTVFWKDNRSEKSKVFWTDDRSGWPTFRFDTKSQEGDEDHENKWHDDFDAEIDPNDLSYQALEEKRRRNLYYMIPADESNAADESN